MTPTAKGYFSGGGLMEIGFKQAGVNLIQSLDIVVKDNHSLLGLRPFSVREYARLQGVPDDYLFENTRDSYRIIGNSVAVPVGRWCGEQAMKYFN